jgi:hypothetical protein
MNAPVRKLLSTALLAAIIAGSALSAGAQAGVTQSATATRKATIEAIDHSQRIVTLQFEDGTTQTIGVSPSVKRFRKLKVGDVVTFTETDSVVFSIAKPGTVPAADSATMTAAAGDKPGGTEKKTVTAIVTVTAIDPAVPAITVKTSDGRILSFKVNDPKNIVGVKVGDEVQIAYTSSLVVSVK